jgi:hypothetical protein
MELDVIIAALESAFERTDVKKAVLDEDWYSLNIESGIHTTGFCFAASEVIYRLNGKGNWKVVSLKDPDHWNNGTHYFLKNRNSGEIFDVTRNQYEERGIEIPYDLGKGRGLRNISNKAKTLSQMAGLGELPK